MGGRLVVTVETVALFRTGLQASGSQRPAFERSSERLPGRQTRVGSSRSRCTTVRDVPPMASGIRGVTGGRCGDPAGNAQQPAAQGCAVGLTV
jgi:hypothetical protein